MHALAGRDRERVIVLAEKYLMAKLWRGEFRIVRRWTETVPAEWAATYPLFGLIRSGALAFSGAIEAAAHSIDETEANLRARLARRALAHGAHQGSPVWAGLHAE
jgi:ATP/maltotriose-dependent transcriptional regulator MalT